MIHGLNAEHIIDGISFKDIRINGTLVTPENSSKFFDVNEFVKGFKVEE